MKNLIYTLSLAFIFCANYAEAQLQKGDWMIGGGLRVSNQSDFSDDFRILITPTAGYFFADKWLVGTSLALDRRSIDDFSSSVNTFESSLFLRRYFKGGKWQPYVHLEGFVRRANFSNNDIISDFTRTASGLYAQLGFNYFLSKNVAINPRINVNLIEDRLEYSSTIANEFNTIGQNRVFLGFGIQFFLNNKNTELEEQGKKRQRPLYRRYFQKGNQSIAASGALNFDPFILSGAVAWKKFIKKYTRLNWVVEPFLGVDVFGSGLGGLIVARPEIEHFFQINDRFFFVPSLGVNLLFSTGFGETELDVNVQTHPRLAYFFDKVFIEAGFLFEDTFFAGDVELEGSVTAAAEYFIQDNLSLRAEVWHDIAGPEHRGDFFLFDRLESTVFRVGINYFFNKPKEVKE